MRIGSNKFGNSMGECRVWINVEDREGILALVHSSIREYHRNEMNTSILQERHGR